MAREKCLQIPCLIFFFPSVDLNVSFCILHLSFVNCDSRRHVFYFQKNPCCISQKGIALFKSSQTIVLQQGWFPCLGAQKVTTFCLFMASIEETFFFLVGLYKPSFDHMRILTDHKCMSYVCPVLNVKRSRKPVEQPFSNIPSLVGFEKKKM